MKSTLAQEIYEPETVESTLQLLTEKGDSAVIIAGGTDVVIKLKSRILVVKSIIDISKLPLNYIKGTRGKGIQIGATTTASQIAMSEVIKRELPVLSEAAVHLGGPQTQALATIGGNICNSSPSANLSNVLVALGASLIITGTKGEREIPIDEFFVAPGATKLNKNEILTAVVIPPIPDNYGASYIKQATRREMDIAVVGVAVFLILDVDIFKNIRIALASVGPKVFLAEKAQALLIGNHYSRELVVKAAASAAQEASYITDVRATAAYRKRITPVVVSRAIEEAWLKRKGE